MVEWNAVNQWIQMIGAPLLNLVAFGAFGYCAMYSRFHLPFALLALSGLLFMPPDTYWLILKNQHSFATWVVPKWFLRLLFPVQAVSMYLAIIAMFVGDILLVVHVCRANGARHT
jgi:hypothetical protein